MNRYGPKAKKVIEKTMREYKHGELTVGDSDKKVTDRQQAVAIGIDKARRKGYKTPRQKD